MVLFHIIHWVYNLEKEFFTVYDFSKSRKTE